MKRSDDLPSTDRVPTLGRTIREPYSGTELHESRLLTIIESYISHYAVGDSHTARAKRYDLNHFVRFLSEKTARRPADLEVGDWTWQQTQDFVNQRLEGGEAPATVSRRLATLKHLGRTLAERVSGFINPAREVKGPVQRTTCPADLSLEQIEALRNAAQPESPTSFPDVRNQFLLELLLATGLRADEVRLLTAGQISPDQKWILNVRTKGRKFRNVYLDSEIRGLLTVYCCAREEELNARYPGFKELTADEQKRFPLLISLYRANLAKPASFGLSPKSIWRIIAIFGRRAQKNVEDTVGNLHPHQLRHTFAHGLLRSSKDIRLVAQALGHSDVRTTMRYTERSEEELAAAIEFKNSELSRRAASRRDSGG